MPAPKLELQAGGAVRTKAVWFRMSYLSGPGRARRRKEPETRHKPVQALATEPLMAVAAAGLSWDPAFSGGFWLGFSVFQQWFLSPYCCRVLAPLPPSGGHPARKVG